jgi:predicted NUDIX family phosphoesterase
MSQVIEEQILVTPTRLFHELGHFQGFTTDADRYLPTLLAPENNEFRSRPEMEQDPSFKQLIPYVLLMHRDETGAPWLFHYRRGQGNGEARLRKKRSIGIGGHISLVDGDSENLYETGMRRELAEEIRIETSYRERRLGLINDDLTEVGKVHLGVVHLFELDAPQVEPNELDIAETGFAPLGELIAQREEFETWSQICLEMLQDVLRVQ